MAEDGLTIRVDGLKNLNRALRKIDSEAPKQLRVALNESADVLVAATRPLIPRRTGRAAASLKAKSTRTAARVSMGSRAAPYMPWLDFGGKVGPKRSVVRPYIKEGRYLFPTLRKEKPAIMRALEQSLVQVITAAGLDVSHE